ncbi:MAG: YicC/YloC family endoribonuclease [Myxococcaceae bacterium]
MLRSMTGFGSGRATSGVEEVTVELKSVNHKFCEVKARLPRELGALEQSVIRSVKDRLARGSIEVVVRRQTVTGSASVPTVDLALAREYQRAFQELAHSLSTRESVSLQFIASQPGVVRVEERSLSFEDAQRALEAALSQALDALVAMRAQEGQAIAQDLGSRIGTVEGFVDELTRFAPQAVEEYRQRLSERIAELARGVPVDPQRLVQEVAVFAERTDVAEELTRLRSHIEQYRSLLATDEPAGRRMDFLVQEMHREVNTTGSKSQHVEISNRVVLLKAEVERIREQVQNVE